MGKVLQMPKRCRETIGSCSIGGFCISEFEMKRDYIFFTAVASQRVGDGATVAQGRALKGPLGLAIAPNGNILTVNADDGLIVETTPGGQQTGARFVDVSHSRNGAGTLFGLAVGPDGRSVYLVNDGNNTLTILH